MPNFAGLHIANELRRFKRAKLTRLAIISLLLIPLLYSALYLWAFWNPLNNTAALPVALVNSDQGSEINGEKINAGDQVVEGLHDNDQMTWSEVSAEEAEQGVRDGKYYFSLELPSDFSAAVTSAAGTNAEKARLIARYNDANGYLSTIIGENVMREVLNVVGTKISAQAVDKVLIGVLNAGTGLSQASAGAGLLADGTGQLVDQVPELRDGTAQLADGLVQLKDGTSQLSDGTQQLVDKVTPLKSYAEDLDKFEGLVQGLGDSSLAVNDAVSKVNSQIGEVAKVQGASADSLRDMAAQLRGLNLPAVNDVAAQLEANARALDAAGLGPDSALTADLTRLSDGTREMSTQLSDPKAKVRSGLDQLIGSKSAIHQLIDGANQINDGAHLIDENMTTARDGAGLIANGTVRLEDGANQLNDGANELHDRLAEGIKQVPTWNEGQRVQSANTIGGPVTIQAQDDSKTSSFGTGLAPFFVALSLFIGGIVVFQLFKPLQQRAIAAGVGSLRAAFDGYLPVALLAVVQAAIVVGVSVGVVGLRPENLLGFTLFAILVATVFMSINQALVAILGAGPGRVTSLGVLMVMAVASGGIYPVETQNGLIEFFNPFNPMTYAVDGLRQTLYGFHDERLWLAVAVLLATLVVSWGVTTLAARMQRSWTMNRLHPVLPT